MNKIAKIILIVLSILLVLIIIAIFLGANYMFKFALEPESESFLLQEDSSYGDDIYGENVLSELDKWFLDNSQEETVTSFDGLKLKGYYLPSYKKSENYVLLIHGYKSSPIAMVPYAKHYYDLGFNLLLPFQRAHGSSEGKYIGMGCLEHYDMLEWINLILEKNPNANILLHGVSMGAATVMLLTGDNNLPFNVLAAIEDCGYSSVEAEFTEQLKQMFGLPGFPIIPASSLITKLKAGYFFGDGNCIEAVENSVTPTLFIHGSLDTFVPFYMLDEIYSAAICEKQKLVVPGAEHASSLYENPELYWSVVDSFVKKYIP